MINELEKIIIGALDEDLSPEEEEEFRQFLKEYEEAVNEEGEENAEI